MSSDRSSFTTHWRALPRTYWILVAGMFVNRLGSFVLPFLAVYLEEQRGLDAGDSGLVIGAWGLGSVAAAVVGGQLADRWGRRRSMLASLVGGAVVLTGFASATGLTALLALALAFGTLAELYRPAVSAAISDLVPPEHRSRAFTYLIWAYNLGFAVSPVLAGALASTLGFSWLFYGDAATMLAAVAVIAIWVPETRSAASASPSESNSGYAFALRDARLRPLLVSAFVVGLAIVQFIAVLGPLMRADGIDVALYGRIIALNGILIVVTQPWLVPLAERLGATRAISISSALFFAGIGLHAFVDAPLAHAGAVAVWTAGEVALFPLINAWIANLAPEHLRGRYQGLYWMASSCANVVGPSLGQLLLERGGASGWALLPFACGVIALAAVRIAARRASAIATAPA